MKQNPIYIGDIKAQILNKEVSGEYVNIEGESYYKISNSDNMNPFFMSIVSNDNHWMYVSSNGGISAGRKNANNALFPYLTDDKITESAEITGSKSIFIVTKNNKNYLWEPFSKYYKGIYSISRNIYKNILGNKLLFEEINHDLQVSFQYQWMTSGVYGFVKQSCFKNISKKKIKINLLDGLLNILPFGVPATLQNSKSNLVNAYKNNELESCVGLGIYRLSAKIVDKAEPSESLKANIVWSVGIEDKNYLISPKQVDNFKCGKNVFQETSVRAEKGAYFIQSRISLKPKSQKKWLTIANVNQSASDVADIIFQIKNKPTIQKTVLDDVLLGSKGLLNLVAASDGIQFTLDKLRTSRHLSNVVFNIMRGGIFDNNYQIEVNDFKTYILNANKSVYERNLKWLEKIPLITDVIHLKNSAIKYGDSDIVRLTFEYLPLKFSRRHGDPSRPWNIFSINIKNETDGSKILDYEGNWRDIFQNWEALAISYPEFLEGMIHKFLNASTFDGYNPYRISKGGFDWETITPGNPWSFIGYWGDHQAIYLLKLLESLEQHYPQKIAQFLQQSVFVYANVPYKIKPYIDILKNPKDTIYFDEVLNKKILKQKEIVGADATLLKEVEGNIYHVNLLEKLLVIVLTKCVNFIPEAGIWMNTQRPEWNDANNALVGNGASMVTLYQLRRFVVFFNKIITKGDVEKFAISKEMVAYFLNIKNIFSDNINVLKGTITDSERKRIVDKLGTVGSKFRWHIYNNAFSGEMMPIFKNDILSFLTELLNCIDNSIKKNKRSDTLYHSYNSIKINNAEIKIANLPLMLEGQVNILGAGYLSALESLNLLKTLKKSTLYIAKKESYLLYPNKKLNCFVAHNNIPSVLVKKSVLLNRLLQDSNKEIIEKDINEEYHFNSNFNNCNSLKKALDKLPDIYSILIEKEKNLILNIFESVFKHNTYTGRSGTFFAYEGLGSIYWHMVSKLALSVQENFNWAVKLNESQEVLNQLKAFYFDVVKGLGVHKLPQEYGAFPTDPYSHTPSNKGVQQPGMTGQVKEDLLCRMGELGVTIDNGCMLFSLKQLKMSEFIREKSEFKYIDVNLESQKIKINDNGLGFTYCQVPIIYNISNKNKIDISFTNGCKESVEGLILNKELSFQIFGRMSTILNLKVKFDKNDI